jgi:hypothetical protein
LALFLTVDAKRAEKARKVIRKFRSKLASFDRHVGLTSTYHRLFHDHGRARHSSPTIPDLVKPDLISDDSGDAPSVNPPTQFDVPPLETEEMRSDGAANQDRPEVKEPFSDADSRGR